MFQEQARVERAILAFLKADAVIRGKFNFFASAEDDNRVLPALVVACNWQPDGIGNAFADVEVIVRHSMDRASPQEPLEPRAELHEAEAHLVWQRLSIDTLAEELSALADEMTFYVRTPPVYWQPTVSHEPEERVFLSARRLRFYCTPARI